MRMEWSGMCAGAEVMVMGEVGYSNFEGSYINEAPWDSSEKKRNHLELKPKRGFKIGYSAKYRRRTPSAYTDPTSFNRRPGAANFCSFLVQLQCNRDTALEVLIKFPVSY